MDTFTTRLDRKKILKYVSTQQLEVMYRRTQVQIVSIISLRH